MKKRKLGFLKVLFIAIPTALAILAAVFALDYFTGYEIYRQVKYGEGEENVMDVYIPKAAYGRDTNGCVLFIHGGSWSGGDLAEESARCRLLASRGYITATMNYTLWSETLEDYTVFTVLDEIDAALIRLKDFSAERGINIDKAATSGYSAGAHLSMLYSYSRWESAPMEISFAASMAGPADISKEVWGEEMSSVIAELLCGVNLTPDMLNTGAAEEIFASISPTAYIDESTPPTLFMQGGEDTVVPPQNAEVLRAKLTENGVVHEYVYLENSDHSLIQNPIKHLKFYGLMLRYCDKYFG